MPCYSMDSAGDLVVEDGAWYYVKRVFKQHGSLVVTLPAHMCKNLDFKRGDYVVFEVDYDEKAVKFYRWHKRCPKKFPDYYGADFDRAVGCARPKAGARRVRV